jgi:Zn-dependent protease/CBS domain-containing protein
MLPEREEVTSKPEAPQKDTDSGWSFRVARIAGIPVKVHFTFLLLFVWVFVVTSGQATWSVIALVLGIFVCVILHEYGHALTARRYGIQTRDITLYPIGGVATIQGRPKPREELWIALAGPAVNVAIAILLALFSRLAFGRWPLIDNGIVTPNLVDGLFTANLLLPAFNMIPAFPMDGGRVLRAFLALNMDEARATQIAGSIGQLLAIGFGIFALIKGQILFMLIAFFVFLGAAQEMAATLNMSFLAGRLVYEAMQRRFRTIQSGATLNEAADMLLEGSQHDFPVVVGEEVVGILTRSSIARGLAEKGPGAYVAEFTNREVKRLDVREPLDKAADLFTEREGQPAMVYEGERLVGMLTAENLGEFIMLEHAKRQSRR